MNKPSVRSLTELRARDLMQTDLLTLNADSPIREAIETIEDYGISGVPVLDGSGRVVGVLSEHDVARSEHVARGRLRDERGDYDLATAPGDAAEVEDEEVVEEALEFNREDYSPAVLGPELVQDWMNPRVVSVGPAASLKEVCELMRKESVHRVLVIERNKLLGIVSTMDIVGHLADAI